MNDVVCPALAGMSPHRSRSDSNGTGLPRTRGDEPGATSQIVDLLVSAPHSRG